MAWSQGNKSLMTGNKDLPSKVLECFLLSVLPLTKKNLYLLKHGSGRDEVTLQKE